ncbi:hypothetical protein [Ornithinimicrobium avium]|nr:hypothetical protein [Ornithinimicrobium avium]
MSSRLLAATMIAAPVLFTAQEVTRLTVEHGHATDASMLASIADHRGTWEVFGWLVLLTAPVWVAAMVGLASALRPAAPRWALGAGTVAVLGGVGLAMHHAIYVEDGAIASGLGDPAAAQQVLSGSGGTRMEDAALVLMIGGMLLGVLLLGVGLARARVIPWWAFACLPAWVVVTAMSDGAGPLLGLGNLVLLAPFALAAVSLLRGADEGARVATLEAAPSA